MKTFTAIICFVSLVALVLANAEDDRKKAKVVHQECQDDPATHVDEEILKKFRQGEDVDKALVGSHMLCMSTKFGVIDENGKVNKDKLKKALGQVIHDETKLKETLDSCGEDKATPQETALAIDKCFREHVGNEGHHHHH